MGRGRGRTRGMDRLNSSALTARASAASRACTATTTRTDSGSSSARARALPSGVTGQVSERKCFYLTTHSTHFYLRLYGVTHMVKDHSDSEEGNPLPPHGLLFPISSKGSFMCIIPDRITHTTTFVTPVMENWLE